MFSAAQEALGGFFGAVKMGGGYDGSDALLAGAAEHFHRHLGGFAAVVHLGQKMAVYIEHGIPPVIFDRHIITDRSGRFNLIFANGCVKIAAELSAFLYQMQGAFLRF